MSLFRKFLIRHPVLKSLSSIKITAVCLGLLFILTLWGTIAQIEQGLYNSQHKFFYSWYFLAGGFIPFPGAQLVLWVLFINLVCVSMTRFVYKWSHLGILIIHMGLLSYFVAAFVTFHVTQESNITLLEKEATDVSSDYHQWELSVWPDSERPHRDVTAVDTEHLVPSKEIPFEDLEFTLTVKDYYSNAEAYTGMTEGKIETVNQSGIRHLSVVDRNIEPEKNIPGGVFRISDGTNDVDLMLYGAETQPNKIKMVGQGVNFQLRRKRYPLPFTLKLNDFDMEMHPGTTTAKSYKSHVEIEHHDISRDVLIWMNHPFHYKDFTLYQASYSVDSMGRQRSTLAVVKNAGRWLPYISSLMTFVGLAVHFLAMAFPKKKEINNA